MAVPRLQVIATTEEGTRAALVAAGRMARRLNADRVVLLVARTDSHTSVAGGFVEAEAVDRYRRIARRSGIDVVVRLCCCNRHDEAFRWMLPHRSTVVVGGRRRWWWPTREQRIAGRLERLGHQTFFADAREPAAAE